MIVKMDNVLWQFAKMYRKKHIADHPGKQIGMNIAVVATLQAFRATGHAVEKTDADGNSIWKATPKFLRETGLEPGALIIFGLEVH